MAKPASRRRRASLTLRQIPLLGTGLGIFLPALVLAYFQISTPFDHDVDSRVRVPLPQYADVLARGVALPMWTLDYEATTELADAIMSNPTWSASR